MSPSPATSTARLPVEIQRRKRVIWGELKERVFWFIRLRWWVSPAIVTAALAGRLLQVEFSIGPVLAVAAGIGLYNAVFHVLAQSLEVDDAHRGKIERFTYFQVVFDYLAMFGLIHFTGGAASPLIFFFIFHIIFASILLPRNMAYWFAAMVAAGMALIAGAEYLGILAHHPIVHQGTSIDLTAHPYHMSVEMAFFAASLFITAYFTTGVVTMLRRRIVGLAELSEAINQANSKLSALYTMTQAILSERNLDEVLHTVTTDLARVMEVRGISVKLISKNGRALRYEASHGLPDRLTRESVIDIDQSPLNRRIIQGQPFITGRLSEKESFQFGEDLTEAGIQSVLFAPLKVEDRVIGILGAYCVKPDRFDNEDVEFFRLAAGLAALAVENARAYESIENLIQERSRFMLRVSHNLRAPLAAVISMVEVLRLGHLGAFNSDQAEHLRRVDRRVRTMLEMINELLTLAQGRTDERTMEVKPLGAEWLAGRLERTFMDKAAEKGIRLTVRVAPNAPSVAGDPEMIEQLLENLVSNALKYNHAGGKVEVSFERGPGDDVRIEVRDDGIGVPKEQMPRLFTEFFRADNAKRMVEVGTGLGLSIVKDIVERHGGRVFAESTEGLGTIFMVSLPAFSAPPTKEGTQ